MAPPGDTSGNGAGFSSSDIGAATPDDTYDMIRTGASTDGATGSSWRISNSSSSGNVGFSGGVTEGGEVPRSTAEQLAATAAAAPESSGRQASFLQSALQQV